MMMACDHEDVKFVGGAFGGFLFPEFLYATDGMFSVAKILELIAKSGYSIDELDRNTPRLHMMKENLECSRDEKGSIMRKFMENTMNYRQGLIDGVKVFLEKDTTVLCIPDRDRNLVHLNVESPTKIRTRSVMKEYKKMVQSYISKEKQ